MQQRHKCVNGNVHTLFMKHLQHFFRQLSLDVYHVLILRNAHKEAVCDLAQPKHNCFEEGQAVHVHRLEISHDLIRLIFRKTLDVPVLLYEGQNVRSM